MSTEDTTITLTRSENPSVLKMKDQANLWEDRQLKLSSENTKDINLLPKNYCDEVELRRKELASNEMKCSNSDKNTPIGSLIRRSKEGMHSGPYYGQNNLDPSAENYITDAEINTRGYIDRNGQIHYSIPLLPKEIKSTKLAPKKDSHIVSSKQSDSSDIKSESREGYGNIIGTMGCPVGDGNDRGILDYQVYDSGRVYNLKCPDGRSLVLSFSKKSAGLETNWHKSWP
uniref:Neprosin activation peptide domain-containing protein n=1 Tax=Setaria digitata TaxID=48799 RepID=A0A915PY83_9BILA